MHRAERRICPANILLSIWFIWFVWLILCFERFRMVQNNWRCLPVMLDDHVLGFIPFFRRYSCLSKYFFNQTGINIPPDVDLEYELFAFPLP
jgi:hypothetical protein